MTTHPARLSAMRTTPSLSTAAPTGTAAHKRPWWHISLFRGMINDVRRRLPYYKSDWTDAWDYRIVPSTGLSCPLSSKRSRRLTWLGVVVRVSGWVANW